MPRIIRENASRDENVAPSASDCVAHRCAEHAGMAAVDDRGDDGSECGICVGQKFAEHMERALVDDILKALVWPMVQSARDRLNLLSGGAGDRFEQEMRTKITAYKDAA
jgi:hypothetical protein